METIIRKVCLYFPTLVTVLLAFRVWNAGHITSAALLTSLCCTLAFVAIATE
ncbi:hypothetical protein ACOIPX_005354 [Salmonella enterica]|nr:hypothetical protein [Salmonella enterica subsp. diarizonae]EGW7922006.1 hypothetical protein [Salmonella enterica]HBM0024752.1 hypothetical protein [Salmonella enterica subsp. enterica serovar Muenchen]HCM8926098.1 hypothetical protein [Salmonella enterica subsp. enterica serovar Paratyphi B]EEF7941964.1 hypothetical protein [Salmonella enterica subsp. diarizonae]